MKKPKLTETVAGDDGTLDRISNLPDSLLVRIISLLPTTKEAFITSLVSKRWQYLWTCIDNLILLRNKSAVEDFVSFVEYVFAKRTCSKIRKFHLHFWDIYSYSFYIDKWLSYAIKYNVEHVFLKSNFFKPYMLDRFFCTYSSLITLDLSYCLIDKEVAISWKSLKTLKVECVELDDEFIVKLLSGCPELETLELSLYSGFHRLEINNSNLKTLKLHQFWSEYGGGDSSLEVFAPYLQHLDISGDNDDLKCRLLNVSSLVSASLAFDIRCVIQSRDVFWTLVLDYVEKLSHVTELTIGNWFAEVLFMLLVDGVQLPEMKCKCLTLNMQMTKYNLYGVASLLQASPHVETVNIGLEANAHCYPCYCESSYKHKGDSIDLIDLESWISNLAFCNLKSVNVICPIEMCWRERHDKLFELSELLLKNGSVLEKFVIIAKRIKCFRCSRNCVFPYSSGLTAKLLGCQKPSTNIRITFHESYFS